MTLGHNETVDCFFGLCWQCDKKKECACNCHRSTTLADNPPVLRYSLEDESLRGRRAKASYGLNGEYRERVNGSRRVYY